MASHNFDVTNIYRIMDQSISADRISANYITADKIYRGNLMYLVIAHGFSHMTKTTFIYSRSFENMASAQTEYNALVNTPDAWTVDYASISQGPGGFTYNVVEEYPNPTRLVDLKPSVLPKSEIEI